VSGFIETPPWLLTTTILNPSSTYSLLRVTGTDACHHFQSLASDANFFPEAVEIRVES